MQLSDKAAGPQVPKMTQASRDKSRKSWGDEATERGIGVCCAVKEAAQDQGSGPNQKEPPNPHSLQEQVSTTTTFASRPGSTQSKSFRIGTFLSSLQAINTWGISWV